jgi:SOS-response transcriptional repressor LexA
MAVESIRPTKKQRELLSYIEEFIRDHGYSPSYREIMNGLQYTSVATVSLHVNSLIRRGHLRKRDRSARSLEVVIANGNGAAAAGAGDQPREEQWLVAKVEQIFSTVEAAAEVSQEALDELRGLVGSLKVLGLHAAAEAFDPRLKAISEKVA